MALSFGIALGLVAVTLSFCAWVDPYGLRVHPGTSAAHEAEAIERTERPGEFLRKAIAVRVVMPRTVILGTSRANSLRSEHPAFGDQDRPVLNLALGGATIEQLRLLLIHANTISRVRKAVIGLDLQSFLDKGRRDFQASQLAGNADSPPFWLARLRADFSRNALAAALSQVLGQTPTRITYEERLEQLGGQRELIRIAEFNSFYSRLAHLFPPERLASRWGSTATQRDAMRSFQQLLAYARKHDIELALFISPVHARFLEWYQSVGWWTLFHDWKRELVRALAALPMDAAGARIELWDFSGFYSVTTEALPGAGDPRGRMTWYLDTSHYSPALGDLILERVLRTDSNSPVLPNASVQPANIEAHLMRLAIDAERYRISARGEVEDVRNLVGLMRRVARR